jgi:hypothetical protein
MYTVKGEGPAHRDCLSYNPPVEAIEQLFQERVERLGVEVVRGPHRTSTGIHWRATVRDPRTGCTEYWWYKPAYTSRSGQRYKGRWKKG